MNFKPRPDIPPSLYMALTESVYQDELAKYFRSLPEQSKKLKAFSATTLPRAPRQRVLEARWGKDLVVDPVRERFWSMWGQLAHLLLEKNAREGDLIEKRLGWDVGPFPDGSFIHIHGQPDALYMSDYDLVENGELLASVKAGDMDDWKVTSARSMLYGEKDEFIAQLNINAWIARRHGHTVKRLRNILLFRDWKANELQRNELYPKEKILVIEQPMWTDEETLRYIMDRAWEHSQSDDKLEEDLPLCTPDERWQRGDLFKIYKLKEDGSPQDKAKLSCDNRKEAEERMEEIQSTEWGKILDKNNEKKKPKPESDLVKPEYTIKHIPPQPVKCGYCAGSTHCSQLRADMIAGLVKQLKEEEEENE